jgi:rhodanese-related sulfurtransferase
LIPKGSEIIFYCAEPKEATSARMALLLSSHGYKKLHPLGGGLEAWRRAGFAVEAVLAVDVAVPEGREGRPPSRELRA